VSESTLLLVFLVAAMLAAGVAVVFGRVPVVGDQFPKDGLHADPVSSVPAIDRYARFARRDYSSDRGSVPTGPPPAVDRFGGFVVPRWTDFYAELAARLGDPLGGAS
jgi:hypothetical protein